MLRLNKKTEYALLALRSLARATELDRDLDRTVPVDGAIALGRPSGVVTTKAIAQRYQMPETLLAKGLIKKGKTPVKVLAQGDLNKALTIQAHAFSQGAKDKISAAGGSAVELTYDADADVSVPVERPVPAERPAAAPKSAKATAKPDDLKRIEGIGPKIEGVLHDNGITTFAQLAKANPEALSAMLSDVGGSHDPTTWPEQAALAAAGNWNELQELQDNLKGGRRE